MIDLVPTVLEVAGGGRIESWDGRPVPPPPGKSLVSTFAKDGTVEHGFLWWSHEGNRAVRVGDWKLVAAGADGTWELYDLGRDRNETNDVAGEHPDMLRKLEQVWQQRMAEFREVALRDLSHDRGQVNRDTKAPGVR